jgi:D-3-phosphoglycerate dehydrogenase/(S)-sulfolactate dehydrogenase
VTATRTGNQAEILVAEDVWGEPFDELAHARSVLRTPHAWADPAALRDRLAGVRGLVVRNRTQVDRDLLESASALEVVGRAGVGLDNIDLVAADELGVVVVAPLGVNAISVAEHTLALALALLRQLVDHDRAVRAGEWVRHPGRELAGRTWGLLGAGATARAVARLAGAFGAHVIGYDPYVSETDGAAAGIDLASLHDVLTSAEVLSIHLPATPQTRGLIDEDALRRMRSDSLLINVGRGEVVDEQALAAALSEGRIGGAGLDVREHEPPGHGVLDTAPHTVFTPHVAGITAESQHRIAAVLAEDVSSVLAGARAAHAVGRHSTSSRGRQ